MRKLEFSKSNHLSKLTKLRRKKTKPTSRRMTEKDASYIKALLLVYKNPNEAKPLHFLASFFQLHHGRLSEVNMLEKFRDVRPSTSGLRQHMLRLAEEMHERNVNWVMSLPN